MFRLIQDLRRFSLSFLAASISAVMVTPQVSAHRLNAFAWREKDNVNVEAYYSKGEPAGKARVEVYTDGGHLLLTGLTDRKGVFRCRPHSQGVLKIVVSHPDGHRAEFLLEAEITESSGDQEVEQTRPSPPEAESRNQPPSPPAGRTSPLSPVPRPQALPPSVNSSVVNMNSVLLGLAIIFGLTLLAWFLLGERGHS